MRESHATIKYGLASYFIQSSYGGGDLLDCPDAPGTSTRVGGRPDFVFNTPSGILCALELSDLMPENLKEHENFVVGRLLPQLESQLQGTFLLDVIVKPDNVQRVTPSEIYDVAQEIKRVAPSMTLYGGGQAICPGYELFKIAESGQLLHVWLLLDQSWFPIQLPQELMTHLKNRIWQEVTDAGGTPGGLTPCKFDGYLGHKRILILDISRTPLDLELHCSLMRRWLEQCKPGLLTLDEVHVGDYKVWRGNGKQVPVRHKYENHYYRQYRVLWKRPAFS